MDCLLNKPSAVATPSSLDLPPTNDGPPLSAISCPPSSHPNRLIEFEDNDTTMRLLMQYTTESNIRNNSLQFDPREFYRRFDVHKMELLTPQILSEVEKGL
ncbi:unnamed protein product, partial [Rotaria sp. Silwood2]